MAEVKFTEEKKLKAAPGFPMAVASLLVTLAGIPMYVLGATWFGADKPAGGVVLAVCIVLGVLLNVGGIIMFCGLKVIHPNEALVLTLFGSYYGTLYNEGFYWINPFCETVGPAAQTIDNEEKQSNAKSGSININLSGGGARAASKAVSLKTMTLDNKRQKVNDELGNPVEIGTIVIWKVANATKAVLNVEQYAEFLSIQCDAVTRNAARNYPYDNGDCGEKTLRGSCQEIADIMQAELQSKVEEAGLEILDVRITHLAYAPEIAAAMLQRQQAAAIIDALQKIVEGAVGMVEMALNQLSENNVVELDEERKAAMVSNLLVVLCGNKDAQPIVNSGSIY